MYAPEGADSDREYVEVYNATDHAIDLEDWVLIGEDPSTSSPTQDDINSTVTVGSREFAVLCENDDPSANEGIQCAYDYANAISYTNTSDYVVLQDPNGTEIDRVRYDEGGSWPDAVGASLEYIGGPGDDNNHPSNWEVATSRAGDFGNQSGDNFGSPNVMAPGGALPVELSAFAVYTEGDRAVLRWTTASETDNVGFAVQHRASGAHSWREQGFIEGSGTTAEPQAYSFSTPPLVPGGHVFRLKQVDVDGSFHYSEPRRVRIQSQRRLAIGGPNPVSSGHPVEVIVDGISRRGVEVVLYNVLGKRVRSISLPIAPTGRGIRAQMSTAQLAPGPYFIRAHGPTFTETRRITIIE